MAMGPREWIARRRYRRLLCELGWSYLQAVAGEVDGLDLGEAVARLTHDSSRPSELLSAPDSRELDFAGLLSELAALMGQRVRIESAVGGRLPFHFSLGTLAGSLDGLDDSARPIQLVLYLEGYEAGFTLREADVERAEGYTLELDEGSHRTVEVELRGGGHLRIEREAENPPLGPSAD